MTGRYQPLQFASWQTAMRLVGAPKGVRTWHCPCHPDQNPSFSAGPGREPGVTIVSCGAGCSQAELLDYYRKRGYRLGPMRQAPPRKVNRPVTVDTSVALSVCTLSERRIFAMIWAGHDPTYDDMEAAGVRRKSIPPSLRGLQALGLIVVKRANRAKGRQQYERSHYGPGGGWLRWEPQKTPQEMSKAALAKARAKAEAFAKAGRKGGEDITPQASPDTSLHAGKTKASMSGLRFSEVAPRGSVSPPELYVGEEYSSMSQDSSRPAPSKLGARGGDSSADATPEPPPPQAGDPGPVSWEDVPAPAPSPSFSPPDHCSSPYACGKAGECRNQDACPAFGGRRAMR